MNKEILSLSGTFFIKDYPALIMKLLTEEIYKSSLDQKIDFMKIGNKLLTSEIGSPIIKRGLRGYVLTGVIDLYEKNLRDIQLTLYFSNESKSTKPKGSTKPIIIDRIYCYELSKEGEEETYKKIWCPLPKDQVRQNKGEVSHGLVKWIPNIGLLNKNNNIEIELTSPIQNEWNSTITTCYKKIWQHLECIHDYIKLDD